MSVITQQAVRRRLSEDVQTCYNGIRFLLAMQTNGERRDGTTRFLNNVGFKARYPTNQVDENGGRIWRDDHQQAVALLKAADSNPVENWKATHRLLALRLLLGPAGQKGYLRQLTAWANGKRTPAEVSEFKLSALYNEGSRTHKAYVAQQLRHQAAERDEVINEVISIERRIAAINAETEEIKRQTAALLRAA